MPGWIATTTRNECLRVLRTSRSREQAEHRAEPEPYAEGGYGYPESGQTIINVTNGKIIRLLVDDEPFDLRYGQVHRHQRVLDLQAGTLTREVRWSSPAGKTVKVRSERLVSLTQRAVAAICYEVEVEQPALIVVQSELVANEQLPTAHGGDPRVEAALHNPLVAEQHRSDPSGATLIHHTRHSGLRVAAVSNISLVTVGAVIGFGGLGRMFTDGFQRGIPVEIVTGIVLVLLLALIVDGLLLLLGRVLTPWDRVGRTAGRPA